MELITCIKDRLMCVVVLVRLSPWLLNRRGYREPFFVWLTAGAQHLSEKRMRFLLQTSLTFRVSLGGLDFFILPSKC